MTYDFGCKNTPRQNQATHWFQESWSSHALHNGCYPSSRKYLVIATYPGCAREIFQEEIFCDYIQELVSKTLIINQLAVTINKLGDQMIPGKQW